MLGKEPLEIQEPLEIPWPHPTIHEPIGSQTKISWLNAQELVVYLDNRDQIKNQHTTLRKKVTNQTFPYLKILFSMYTPYISNVIQNLGLLPIAAVGVSGSPSSSLVIKTLLLLHQISAPWWSLGDFATWAKHSYKTQRTRCHEKGNVKKEHLFLLYQHKKFKRGWHTKLKTPTRQEKH